MGRHLVFVIFLPFVFSAWDAHIYWNGRYAANGIDYTEDDTGNGMWSDNSDKYMKTYPFSTGCSGCACGTLATNNILQGCDGIVSVVSYSFPDITNETFAASTTSITIQDCTPFNITEDAFTALTVLTSLTIQNCGMTSMPYVDHSPLTILNLIENEINIISTHKGHLPPTLEYLALTHNSLHWLPDRYVTGNNLRLVSLGYNNFTHFPLASFGNLPIIMYLGMEGNFLEKISVNHLQPFISNTFVHLNLSTNMIDYVQPGAFRQLPNIKIIEMHTNYISTLPRGTFENVSELVHLDLHGNHFETFNTEALIDLEQLVELRIHSQDPDMTTILFNSMINIGKSMKYLFVSDNSLTHIPHQIFTENDFPVLIELHADHNVITNVTDLDEKGYGVKLRATFLEKQKKLIPFGNTTNMRTLYLHNNLIKQINDSDLCELQSLQNLYLQNNRLSEDTIQENGFKCLSSLIYLNLDSNNIQYVPIALTTHEKLPSIQTLQMNSNQITFLEAETFTNVSTLLSLQLANNRIVAIENNTFPSQLRTLNLNSNSFRFIHWYQFSNLSDLTTLNLANNEINFLPDEAFINCINLTTLLLNSNTIPQLKVVHLKNCPLTGTVSFSNNHIGWIEDGTFSHITSMTSLDLSNNRLYWLPNGGDFNNLTIPLPYSLSLQKNRISSIAPGTFKYLDVYQLNLQDNRISSISSHAFDSVSVGGALTLSGNQLREIQSNAFVDVTCQHLLMNDMYIGTLPSFAFNRFTAVLVDLQNSQISKIEQNAFNDFKVTGTNPNPYGFFLNNNKLTALETSIFGGTSEIQRFNLNENGMKTIAAHAFKNVTVNYMYLQQNELSIYPVALSQLNMQQLHIYSNVISQIPTGSLAGQTQLSVFSIYDNLITEITSDMFTDATNIQHIYMHNNKIQQIAEGSFSNLDKLKTLNLHNNVIPYFPAIDLPLLETLNLANNLIETMGGIAVPNEIKSLNLNNNPLGCECSTTGSIFNAISAVSSETNCSSPTAVAGVFFASSKKSESLYYDKVDKDLFQCNAENIVGTADSSTSITVQWTRPTKLFDTLGTNTTASYGYTVETWEYVIKCTSTTASTLEKTVRVTVDLPRYCFPALYYGSACVNECLKLDTPTHLIKCDSSCTPTPINNTVITSTDCLIDCLLTDGTVSNSGCTRSCIRTSADLTVCTTVSNHSAEVTFTNTDGVLPLTTYECAIQLRSNGSTSAKSIPAFVHTPATSSSGGGPSIGVTDILVNVTYYDFSSGNDDFSSVSGLLPHSPHHVISPLGSWLAISDNPTSDTFSDWFRSTSSNFEKQDQILLERDAGITSSVVHKYWSKAFYPVDGFGFGTEGQTDCSGGLHNFVFTSAIRTGLKYQGSEKITVGGGEELWLFINKQLVIEIVDDRSTASTTCQMIDLSSAKDSGLIIPQEGVIVNGECVTMTTKPSATVNLKLEINEAYLFEIFHVERMACSSELLIQLEDVYLTVNSSDIPPFHYKFSVDEDYHLNGIIGEFSLWDVFQVGPFQVELQTGNEARHFLLKEDSTANRNSGTTVSPPVYTHTQLYGTNMTFVECTGINTLTPETSTAGTESFTMSTLTALVTVKTELDYEVATEYVLVMEVEETGTSLVGTLVIKIIVNDVNDHCPLLSVTEDVFITPQPLLQIPPLLMVNASDIDSTTNAEFYFYVSTVHTEKPIIDYDEALDLRREIYNGTTEITVTLAVIDEGVPPRGSAINVTVNISNTCLLNEEFEKTNFTFSINKTSGEFYLRVPGYWTVKFECTDDVGVSSGVVRDELMTASSSRSYLSQPERGRLNITATLPLYGPLTGGWVAADDDTDPYIVVNMEAPYIFSKIHLQGQEDEPNWVEAYRMYYSDDGGIWTLYHDANGEFIFLGNNDQNTIKTLILSPVIMAQYIKINPRNWTGSAALRMELSGCTQAEQYHYDTSCERCYTTYYCLGDGEAHMCGRCENETLSCNRSPTEHSFGAASECTTCPKGWLCDNGYATPCPDTQYGECNDTYCPTTCTPCETGYACRGGQRYICEPGTFSDGSLEFCSLCTEGTYQDLEGQDQCKPCPSGYYSSTSKDRCQPCEAGTYSVGDGSGACIGCSSDTECPCQIESTCFSTDLCVNTGSGNFQCLGCPVGFTGDGISCSDIDECALYDPCWNNSACLNTAPGYQCLACPHGFYSGTYEDGLSINNTVRVFELRNEVLSPIQDQTCVDINECLTNNGGCDPNAPCVNTIGSYYCGYCAEGYSGIPSVVCYSTNYCQTGQHKCASVATCTYIGPKEYSCECPVGYTGNGRHCGLDTDLDGHPDISLSCSDWGCRRDNCRTIPNSGQEDVDNDNTGDDCDDDKDNDGKIDSLDNCPYFYSFSQSDTDNDGVGDPCDNCVSVANSDQLDTDKDGQGDICDSDDDNDGDLDVNDNCQFIPNSGQENADVDNFGDACDNCRTISNDNQTDTDQNGVGDICNPVGGLNQDRDGDGVLDTLDNCVEVANGDQQDTDKDGLPFLGDACDPDRDGDGTANSVDNCPYLSNTLQTDINGDQVGDDCVLDSDGDGVYDNNDTCPHNPGISSTSFLDYFIVDLYPGYGTTKADWWVKAAGREIYQLADTTGPSMLIGSQSYGSITYSGTFYVRSDKGDNYFGIVFGYVSNRRFYLVSWKTKNYNFDTSTYQAGIAGVQMKVVESNTGPGMVMAHALWHSSSTVNQMTVLWHDGEMTRWSNYTSYKWILTHNTDLGKIRFQLYDLTSMLTDSGDIYDTSITGGRVGVYQFGQRMGLWSDIKVKCVDRQNMALKFNGTDDYVMLTNLTDFNIDKSFTFEVWIKIDAGSPSTAMPIFCTQSRTICVWLENSLVHGQYGNTTVTGTSTITADQWTSVVIQYDESEYLLKLYLDGDLSGVVNNTEPLDWSTYDSISDVLLYLGRDDSNFFKGYMDEIRFYTVAIIDDEITEHINLASIGNYPKYHKYGQLHFKMNQATGSQYLENEGLFTLSAQIYGHPTFVESHQDFSRFRLSYPTN